MEATQKSVAETLPDEILERIFSYSSHMELIETVQNVSTRWRQVVNTTNRLWKNIVYVDSHVSEKHDDSKPDGDVVHDSDEDIIRILKLSPMLQTVIFAREHSCEVLQTLSESCCELKKLLLFDYQFVHFKFVKNLVENCPQIEHLGISGLLLTNPVLCEMAGRFRNLKTLELAPVKYGTDKRVNLKIIADHCEQLAHFEFRDCYFDMEDFRYFVSKMKDKLQTLRIACSNLQDQCVLPVLCESKLTVLKSLCLFVFEVCGNECKREHLGELKTVTSLTLHQLGSLEPGEIIQLFDKQNMGQLKQLAMLKFYDFDVVKEAICKNCPLLENIVVPKEEELRNYSKSDNKIYVVNQFYEGLEVRPNVTVGFPIFLQNMLVKLLKKCRKREKQC